MFIRVRCRCVVHLADLFVDRAVAPCVVCAHDVRLWTEDDICHALQVEQRYARNRETLEPRLSLKEIALLHACSLEKQTFPQSLLNLVPNF